MDGSDWLWTQGTLRFGTWPMELLASRFTGPGTIRTAGAGGEAAERRAGRLDTRVGSRPDALLITTTDRALDVAWRKARVKVGLPALRLHDLRHSGLTLAAATGATEAELMYRAGHSSPDAALRYQHATRDRDQVIAEALGELAAPPAVVSLESRAEEASGRG